MPRRLTPQINTWTGNATRIPGLLMFGHYQHLAAQIGLEQHRHRGALEICFLCRGEQSYRVGGNVYRLRGGDQFVTFPDEWHDSAGEPQQKGELFWMILKVAPAPDNALHLPSRLHRELLRNLGHLPARHFRATPEAGAWLVKLEAALIARSSPATNLEATSALHQYLLATIEAGAVALEWTPRRRVRDSMDWMEAHLGEPVRVREVAEAVGWSEAHFKMAFRNETGQTPHDYFLRRKIDRARHLLTAGSAPITDVAHSLGFSSSQHFSTAFRKFTGKTPSDLRVPAPSHAVQHGKARAS